jgi:hypothetical protein
VIRFKSFVIHFIRLIRTNVINITNSKNEKLGISSAQSEANKSLKMFIKLFEIKDSSSSDCVNLICLINSILKTLDKGNENAGLKYIFDDCNLSSLWKLYFDPLLISQAINLRRELLQYVGKEKFKPTDAAPVVVKWTDIRSDKYIKETERQRVDYIIEFCLEN